MTVAQLIKQLQKMPQNLQVHSSDQDSSPWETAGYPRRVGVFDKTDTDFQPPDWISDTERERYEAMPKRVVVVYC